MRYVAVRPRARDRRRRDGRRRQRRAPGTAWSGCASASRCTAASSTPDRGEDGGFVVRARLPLRGSADDVRVLIADDQELVRAGFRVILNAEPDIEVVGEASDGAQAVEAAPERCAPTSC